MQNFLMLILGLFVGILSSLLGIGGGVLLVPALYLIFKLQIKEAMGTSLAVITLTALMGSLGYFYQGNVKLKFAFFIILGTILGVQIGLRLNKIAPTFLLQKMFGILLLIVAFKMLVGKP
jgi:hypothetical protein